MAFNLCQQCFDKACEIAGGELDVHGHSFEWSMCAACGGQAEYLVPEHNRTFFPLPR